MSGPDGARAEARPERAPRPAPGVPRDHLESEALGLIGRIEDFANELEDLGISLGRERMPMHGPLDEAAFDRATAAWHVRYRRVFNRNARTVEDDEAHHEAVAEALEEFLGVYERERTP